MARSSKWGCELGSRSKTARDVMFRGHSPTPFVSVPYSRLEFSVSAIKESRVRLAMTEGSRAIP